MLLAPLFALSLTLSMDGECKSTKRHQIVRVWKCVKAVIDRIVIDVVIVVVVVCVAKTSRCAPNGTEDIITRPYFQCVCM